MIDMNPLAMAGAKFAGQYGATQVKKNPALGITLVFGAGVLGGLLFFSKLFEEEKMV